MMIFTHKKLQQINYPHQNFNQDHLKNADNFICKYCSLEFPTKQKIGDHLFSNHYVDTPHQCPHYSYSTSVKHNLKSHIDKKHPNVCKAVE